MVNEQTMLVLESLKVDGINNVIRYCKNCKKSVLVDRLNPVEYPGYCNCNEPLWSYENYKYELKDINEKLELINMIEDDASYIIELVSDKEEYEIAIETFKQIDEIYQEYLKGLK